MPGPWLLRSDYGFWNDRTRKWGGFTQATRYTTLRHSRPSSFSGRPRFQTIDLARRQLSELYVDARGPEATGFTSCVAPVPQPDAITAPGEPPSSSEAVLEAAGKVSDDDDDAWPDFDDADDDDEPVYDDGQIEHAWGVDTYDPDVLADIDNWSLSGHGPFDFLTADGFGTTDRNENAHGWIVDPDDWED